MSETKLRFTTLAVRRAMAPDPLGHAPELGARPLRRTIEDLIVAPLAERMAKDPAFGNATVRIGTAGEPADLSIS